MQWDSADGLGPRERLLTHGEKTLQDHELLAIIFGTGSRAGGDVLALSRQVLARGQGLGGLSRLRARELMQLSGLGKAKACRLRAAFELVARIPAQNAATLLRVASAGEVFARLRGQFAHLARERFVALLLDPQNRVLKEELIAEGTVDTCLVHPRDAFAPAFRELASRILFAHNHPSGDPAPSAADHELTRNLAQAAALLCIPMLDHVIVAGERYFSFAEAGLLARKDAA